MKKLGTILLMVFGLGAITATAQEYDDMYFNSSDRKKAKKEREKQKEEQQTQYVQSYNDGYYQDNYSTHQVNPASIAEYERQAEEVRLQYQSPYNSTNVVYNPSYSDPLDFQYTNPDAPYATEQYQDEYGTTIINNYYGPNTQTGWNGFYGQNGFWNPYGWGGGWTVGIGWGWNSWGYDPFWDPWFWDPWYYRPYTWGWGWGVSPWRRSWGWGNPYCWYDYGGIYYSPNTPTKTRGVTRGPRVDRGGTLVNNGRDTGLRNSSQSLNTRSSAYQQTYANGARGESAGNRQVQYRNSSSSGRYSAGNRSYSVPSRGDYQSNRAGTINKGTVRQGNRVVYPNRGSSDGTIQYNQQMNRGNRTYSPTYQYQAPNRGANVPNRSNNLNMPSNSNRSGGTFNRSTPPSTNRSSGVRSGGSTPSRSSGVRSGGSSGGSRSSGGSSGGGRSGGSSRGGGRGN